MICRHCGIEFDTAGIIGDTVRCPRCGTLYRRKAPPSAPDPRSALTVPVFIPKGDPSPRQPAPVWGNPPAPETPARPAQPAVPRPVPVPVNPSAAVPPANGARPNGAWGPENGNNPPGTPENKKGPGYAAPVPSKRKKTHHVRTAVLLFLLLMVVLAVLKITGLGDIFPRPAEETHSKDPAEEIIEELVEEYINPDDFKGFGPDAGPEQTAYALITPPRRII